MPSTTSSWVSRLFASSTVMTPSFPTFSIASAIKSPMVPSPLADTMPTWAISSLPLVDFENFFSSPTTAATALSTPRLRLIGSWPAATSLAPWVKIARASTVAVVVPSPATSEVFEATSFTICAPMFSNLSASSISFATRTPSLVTVGAPHDFSSTTFRPRGPRVTVTASARMLTPRSTFARASALNSTNCAAIAPSPFVVALRASLPADDVPTAWPIPPAATLAARMGPTDVDPPSLQIGAVQPLNRRRRMRLRRHLDEAEAPRPAIRPVRHDVRGTHRAVGGEDRPEIDRCHLEGQVTDEYPRHCHTPLIAPSQRFPAPAWRGPSPSVRTIDGDDRRGNTHRSTTSGTKSNTVSPTYPA